MIRYAIALMIALTFNATANLLIKFGARKADLEGGLMADGPINAIRIILTNWQLMLGLVLFASNVLFYMYALQKLRVSSAYPIMVGGGFAIIAVVAMFSSLAERLAPVQWAGVVLIMVGIILVASKMSSDSPADVAQASQSATAASSQHTPPA